MNFRNIPQELITLDQWVCWQPKPDPKTGKTKKRPINPHDGTLAKTDTSATWASYHDAVGYAATHGLAGIGFVFTNDDPFVGIDLDDCVDQAGNIHPAAQRIIELCASYAEISTSGTGVHIVGYGSIPKAYKPSQAQPWGGHIEIYSFGRYFVTTGNHVATSPLTVNNMQVYLDMALAVSTKPTPAKPAVSTPLVNVDSAGVNQSGSISAWDRAAIERTIKTAIEIVATALPGQRHNARVRAGELIGGIIHYGLIDRDAAAHLLYSANEPQASHNEEMKAICDGITDGMKKPIIIAPPPPPAIDPMLWPLLNANASNQPNTPNTSTSAPSVVYPNALDFATVPAASLSDAELIQLCEQGQVGVAMALHSIHAHTIAYDTGEKSWYLWNGQRWAKDESNAILLVIRAHVGGLWLQIATKIYAQRVVATDVDEQKRLDTQIKLLRNAADRLNKAKELQAVIVVAPTYFKVDSSEWDKNPNLLGCANGYVDLKTGLLITPSPKYFIRKSTNTPAPTARTTPTAWLDFLNDLFPSDSEYATIPAYLKRLFGMALLGKKPTHVLPILWGEGGRNGKGVLLNVLAKVLGDYGKPAPDSLLLASKAPSQHANTPSPDTYHLLGKRLVWASETDESGRFSMAAAKRLSGGDTLYARALHRDPITFEPSHLFILATNHKPKADATDKAFWSRVHLIPFIYRFVHDYEREGLPNERSIIKNLDDKLGIEASAILGWLIEGCLEYQQIDLSPPKIIVDAINEYKSEENVFSDFINNHLRTDKTVVWVSNSSMYAAYKLWASDNGMGQLSNANFAKKIKPFLVAMKGEQVRRNGVYGWRGLALDPAGTAAEVDTVDFDAVGYASNSYPVSNPVVDGGRSISHHFSSTTSVFAHSNGLNSNPVVDVVDTIDIQPLIDQKELEVTTQNNLPHLPPTTFIQHHKAIKAVVVDKNQVVDDLPPIIESVTNALTTATNNPMQAHATLRRALTSIYPIASTYPNEYQTLLAQIEQAAQTLGVDLSKPATLV